ncbi:hypothetical protein EVAR_6345_1 [Eumeta japonica]|uniref:Uncharacterized protein n=1 Tax=Eumeta variegata TaxID=151549 RepID=A0A4C1T8H5_EUMVA|nr:hypothetical protein EVAR_6345_1 [Eumeta japonica]
MVTFTNAYRGDTSIELNARKVSNVASKQLVNAACPVVLLDANTTNVDKRLTTCYPSTVSPQTYYGNGGPFPYTVRCWYNEHNSDRVTLHDKSDPVRTFQNLKKGTNCCWLTAESGGSSVVKSVGFGREGTSGFFKNKLLERADRSEKKSMVQNDFRQLNDSNTKPQIGGNKRKTNAMSHRPNVYSSRWADALCT